jgi:hypothetical protein
MENEFVPYYEALALKELGFDEPCFTYYYELNSNLRTRLGVDINNAWTYSGNTNFGFTLAPLYQQVFRWFRETYNVHMYPQKFTDNTWYVSWGDWESPVFETYEEAELSCLNKLIKIAKTI